MALTIALEEAAWEWMGQGWKGWRLEDWGDQRAELNEIRDPEKDPEKDV